MPLHHITAHLRGMAGTQRLRHTGIALDLTHLRGRDLLHGEAVGTHVFRPLATAAAVRVLVHDDFFPTGPGGQCGNRGQSGNDQSVTDAGGCG
ncbi:hypothetical protein SDC9_212854 [bioreactor metagenome]|uniref:Uncharacterized protein n=1 Tax=bioreactor metagenome TaxID=1076179 RepID=A0A645JN37_9ZZZZ